MNSTLANGLNLLQVLTDTPVPHSVSELARDSGLPKSHIHRLLQTLVDSAYVEKTDDRRYTIGVGAFRLGHALLRNIPARKLFLPAMLDAVESIRLPLTLTLPFQSQAISIAHVFQDGRIRDTSETLGTLLPVAHSASGKLFLAYETSERINEILPTLSLDGRGPKAHRDTKSLARHLKQIRKYGFSLNDEENGAGRASPAVPIFDPARKVVAGIGLSGTVAEVVDRLPQRLAELNTIAAIQATNMEAAS